MVDSYICDDLNEIYIFFLLKMKKIDNYGLNYHRYRVQPLVLRILKCFFENTNCKNLLTPGGGLPPCGGSNAPIYTKTIYDLTISVINKCFEFQNDRLKIICIKYNCAQHHCVKGIRNFK